MKTLESMDSTPKSSKGRKLPSPNGQNPKMTVNSGRSYTRHDKQEEAVGEMDVLSAYVPGEGLFHAPCSKRFVFTLHLNLCVFTHYPPVYK